VPLGVRLDYAAGLGLAAQVASVKLMRKPGWRSFADRLYPSDERLDDRI
jgi:hypothetical protein